MKIAFIVVGPNYLHEDEWFPHIGMGYLISYLEKKHHECMYFDLKYDELDAVELFAPDVIGISVTSSHFDDIVKITEEIRKKSSPIIILGGPHVGIALGEVLKEKTIDYAIYGEGENAISDLMTILENEELEKLANIQGLIYRRGDKVVVNPQGKWIDPLDALPFPAHHQFQKYPYGRYPLFTSRGCPFSCVYCAIGEIWGRKVRSRSAQNIVGEMEYILNNFGRKPFVTLDDTFNVNIKRVKEFCRLLIQKRLNVEWSCWSFRADNIDRELAELMARSGCYSVSIGIESANPQILKNIKKGETIEEITRGIGYLHAAGISIHGNFIIGCPGDTLDTVKESIKYARKQRLTNFDFYLALPYPGTELWDYVEKNGKLLVRDYTHFSHFSNDPVFETNAFSFEERKEGLRLALQAKKINSLYRRLEKKRSISDIYRSSKRIVKSVYKKYFLNNPR